MNDITIINGQINPRLFYLSISFGGRFHEIKIERDSSGLLVYKENRFGEIMLELGYAPIQVIVLTAFVTEIIEWVETNYLKEDSNMEFVTISLSNDVFNGLVRFESKVYSFQIQRSFDNDLRLKTVSLPESDELDWFIEMFKELMVYA